MVRIRGVVGQVYWYNRQGTLSCISSSSCAVQTARGHTPDSTTFTCFKEWQPDETASTEKLHPNEEAGNDIASDAHHVWNM